MPPYPPGCPPVIEVRVGLAVRHALLDLLRPVFARDVPVNLFGRIGPDNPARGRVASWSPLAGWGVPVREMERKARAREMERKIRDSA